MLGSDVIYSEEAVRDLIETLVQLSGPLTTIILAGELRNGRNFDFGIQYNADISMPKSKRLIYLQMPSSNTF